MKSLGHDKRGWLVKGNCEKKESAMSKREGRPRKGCGARKRIPFGWKKNIRLLAAQVEAQKKEAEEHALRSHALDNFARQEAGYKERLEAAVKTQEMLMKQLEILKRANMTDHQVLIREV